MKNFYEWLEERDAEMLNEAKKAKKQAMSAPINNSQNRVCGE